MDRVIFDVETNGLLDVLDTIHSLVLKCADTGTVKSYTDADDRYPSIKEGLAILKAAKTIIGHNILGFDIPAINKVFPGTFDYELMFAEQEIIDTLVCSRVIWANMKEKDFLRREKGTDNGMPGNFIGRHGLESWGWRLKLHKGDFKKEMIARYIDEGYSKEEAAIRVWAFWSVEMQDYCEQDVEVTYQLLLRIEKKEYDPECMGMEQKFQILMFKMENTGFPFDVAKAEKLYGSIAARKHEIEKYFEETIPDKVIKTPFTPKVNRPSLGYEKGVPTFKTKTIKFNPGSRDHIAAYLIKTYGWVPQQFTPKDNKPKIDENVLGQLPYKCAALFTEYMMTTKVMAFLADGKNGWLKLVKDGKLHGYVNPMGTVTGRCSHSKPNLAQVPSAAKPFGKECRSLFTVLDGYKLVGVDASGLELRCLAHYMYPYDNGEYAREVIDGDIHTVNRKAAGLPTRDIAKTFIYAVIYGAGPPKIGSIIGKGSKAGAALIKKFFNNIPALGKLKDLVIKKVKKTSSLLGIDNRTLHVRSSHSALNTLLQSAGAIAMKNATVILYYKLHKLGFVYDEDWMLVGHIHDEIQMMVKEEHAETVAKTTVEAIREAGKILNFKCDLDGDYKIGKNWAETH